MAIKNQPEITKHRVTLGWFHILTITSWCRGVRSLLVQPDLCWTLIKWIQLTGTFPFSGSRDQGSFPGSSSMNFLKFPVKWKYVIPSIFFSRRLIIYGQINEFTKIVLKKLSKLWLLTVQSSAHKGHHPPPAPCHAPFDLRRQYCASGPSRMVFADP